MDASIGDPRLAPSVERAFEVNPMPGFFQQVTLRAMFVSVVLALVFCFVTLRIHMTVGIVPPLCIPASVLSFYFLKYLISLVRSCGIATLPYTRQENVFVVTSVNACVNMALTGGFATAIPGMSCVVARALDKNVDKQDIVDNIGTGKFIIFLLLMGLSAIFLMIPLKQIFLIDYRLPFPSGMVTAHLVNSFHTPEGAYVAKLQLRTLLKSFLGSFSWSVFQWFYTAGNDCGFQSFPTFGRTLYEHRFFFDFSASYVGLGMLCPYIINLSLLFGGILSWGFLYPIIDSKAGLWYHEKSPTSLIGSNGYKVFMGITIILTDGTFNFITILATTWIDFYHKRQEQESGIMTYYISKHPSLNYDDRKRIEFFLTRPIPSSIPVAGYVVFATLCTIVIPQIFSQISWYHVAVLYMIAPIFSFSNTYGAGLTDWSTAPTYCKFAIFVVAAWIGKSGAVIASLVACEIIQTATHVSCAAIQDYKTGYMTMTSQKVMLTGQIFGIILGSIVNPYIFYAFQQSGVDPHHPNDPCYFMDHPHETDFFPVGSSESEYPCPYAGVYRAIGIIGMGGVKQLPLHCVKFCVGAFCITLGIDCLKLMAQKRGWTMQKYFPNMTAMAIPFFTGAFWTISMCFGNILLLLWNRIDSQRAEQLSSAVAAGLICGEGIFSLPAALLGMWQVYPPMCMKFLSTGKELKDADDYLSRHGFSATT